jgi:RNA polymerase sigma-70 factor, ECF subfamily
MCLGDTPVFSAHGCRRDNVGCTLCNRFVARAHFTLLEVPARALQRDSSFMEETAKELGGRASSAEGWALSTLYDRYAPRLARVALRVVGQMADAEDVVHDAFLAVMQETAPARACFVTVVRELAKARVRRAVHHESIGDETTADRPAEAPDDAPLRRALAAIPSAQRKTIERLFLDGMSYEEVAASEHVALGTIKSRASRGLARLRRSLGRAEPCDTRGRR